MTVRLLIVADRPSHGLELDSLLPKWLSLGLNAITLVIAYVQARRKGPCRGYGEDAAAAALLETEGTT